MKKIDMLIELLSTERDEVDALGLLLQLQRVVGDRYAAGLEIESDEGYCCYLRSPLEAHFSYSSASADAFTAVRYVAKMLLSRLNRNLSI